MKGSREIEGQVDQEWSSKSSTVMGKCRWIRLASHSWALRTRFSRRACPYYFDPTHQPNPSHHPPDVIETRTKPQQARLSEGWTWTRGCSNASPRVVAFVGYWFDLCAFYFLPSLPHFLHRVILFDVLTSTPINLSTKKTLNSSQHSSTPIHFENLFLESFKSNPGCILHSQ